MKKPNTTISKILKRDGTEVKFDPRKIEVAIGKAVHETGEFDEKETKRLSQIVVALLSHTAEIRVPSVEEVQDVVEQVLMAAGQYETARAYILYREKRAVVRRVESVIGVEDDLGLSMNQLRVIEKRYLMHDEDGSVLETPKEWLMRVATTLAKVESKRVAHWRDQFFEVMARFEFLPAGRTLNNAGTKQSQLANCFVLPVEDSMEAIFDAVKWTALVHQTGGGTGFNFSTLRPNGDSVSRSEGGYATGPVSFMKVFDVATRQVMQGGKKRGANMGILNVDHPDIIEFITCKTQDGEIANFNISVGITDEFMMAVEADEGWQLKNPRTGEVVHEIGARVLFDQIVALAWRTGDPGMINLSAINRNNPLLDTVGPIVATNPCGEQPLHAFDACNLGSLNLAAFVKSDNKQHTTENMGDNIDWERLRHVTQIGVRMLDNVIDACNYPLAQIQETVRSHRRIGLGVMGWADMLYRLGVPYDSEEAVVLAERVMGFVQAESWKASQTLAEEKGVFAKWKESWFCRGWDPVKQRFLHKKKPLRVRNVAITTIAPTGTISMAAETSSGIEPVFALSFVKQVVSDEGLVYANRWLVEGLRKELTDGEAVEEVLMRLAQEGNMHGIDLVSEQLKRVYVTAHEVGWEWHVKMQAAFQKHTDNAVSKTINFPAQVSMKDIAGAYLLAWKLGCKGITVYRDSSKSYQVLTTKKEQTGEKSPYLIQSKMKTKTLKQRKAEGLKSEGVAQDPCEECGGVVVLAEGCRTCQSCGWSACG